MFRKTFVILVAVVAASAMAGKSQAQEFPGLGVGAMWQANMNFDRNFDAWNWQRSQEVARQMRGRDLGINAMTLSRSNQELQGAYQGYNNNSSNNSNNQLNAIEGYDYGAVRGQAIYGNNNGQNYMMPYGPAGYNMGPAGYMYQGVNPYDPNANFYPMYP